MGADPVVDEVYEERDYQKELPGSPGPCQGDDCAEADDDMLASGRMRGADSSYDEYSFGQSGGGAGGGGGYRSIRGEFAVREGAPSECDLRERAGTQNEPGVDCSGGPGSGTGGASGHGDGTVTGSGHVRLDRIEFSGGGLGGDVRGGGGYALSAGATFIARTFDVDAKGMQGIFKEAVKHKGTSFVEIYQNCNIYNDGTFSPIYERAVREDRILQLKHGEPFIFGKNQNKGIRLNGLKPEVVDLENGFNRDELLRHNQYSSDSTLANLLSNFNYPEFPVPMGVLRQIKNSTRESYRRLPRGKLRSSSASIQWD